MSYTEELTQKIVDAYVANPCRETVNALAEETNKSVSSIIAKLSSKGVYQAPVRLTKTGEVIRKKEELVTDICTWLGVDAPSLAKTGKEDLKRVHAALADFMKEQQ